MKYVTTVLIALLSLATQAQNYLTMPDLDLSVVKDNEPAAAPAAPTATPLNNSVVREDSTSWVGRLQLTLDSLCRDTLFESTQLGLCVYDLTDNRPLYAVNSHHRLRPASCQKLVTSITALHTLSAEYQFKTQCCIKGTVSDRTLTGNVYVVGGMDPMLTDSDIMMMAAMLKSEGIDSIAGKLCADLSRKDDLPLGQGWCWDDDYGPLSSLMLNGTAKDADSLLSERFQAAGIRMADKKVAYEVCPPDARTVRQITHPLKDMIGTMLKESDNILAECLFYQLAFQSAKKGAGRKEAALCVKQLLDQLHIPPYSYQVADGSGLSFYNFVTASMLVELLNYAYRRPNIYLTLFSSLPVAGVDGTLKKRMKKTAAERMVYAKTGTITGTSSLSGYAKGGNGHILSFSIINQGVRRSADGQRFQDSVCEALCKQQSISINY